MLVAGFDLATGILPSAEVREYGSRTSTEAGGHRRGARCMGSTVLRAPEVLVGRRAGALPDGCLAIRVDPSPGGAPVQPSGQRRVRPEDHVVDLVLVEELGRIGLEVDRLGVPADRRVPVDVGPTVDVDPGARQVAAKPATPRVDIEDPCPRGVIPEPGRGGD